MRMIISTKKIIIVFFFLTCCLNFFVIEKNGFNSRFKEIKSHFPNYQIDGVYLNSIRNNFANQNYKKNFKIDSSSKKVLILGDSFGQDIFNIFTLSKDLYPEYDFLFIDDSGNNMDHKKLILDQNFLISDIIILSYRWDEKFKDFNRLHKKLSNFIFDQYNKKVIIISNRTEFKTFTYFSQTIIDTIVKKNIPNLKKFNIYSYKNMYFNNRTVHQNTKINLYLKNFSKKKKLIFWNFEKLQCNVKIKECDYITPSGYKIYYDYGHFTIEGAKYFSMKLKDLFYNSLLLI